MDFQQVFRSSAPVQLVNVLSDDGKFSALFAEPFLALCDGQVGRVGVLGEHDLTTVVVELPNTRGVVSKGCRSGQFLKVAQQTEQFGFKGNAGPQGSLSHMC